MHKSLSAPLPAHHLKRRESKAALRQAIASLWHRQGVRVFERVEEPGVEVVDVRWGNWKFNANLLRNPQKQAGCERLTCLSPGYC